MLVVYSTDRLYNHVVIGDAADRPPQHDVRRPGRPHPAGDPGPSRHRRGLGQGPVRSVRHEPAGDLQASPGAGASRSHRARPAGAMATETATGGTAAGHRRLGQRIPAPLGRELRAPGRLLPRSPRKRRASKGNREMTMTATRIDRGSNETTTIYSDGSE